MWPHQFFVLGFWPDEYWPDSDMSELTVPLAPPQGTTILVPAVTWVVEV